MEAQAQCPVPKKFTFQILRTDVKEAKRGESNWFWQGLIEHGVKGEGFMGV